MEGFYPPFGGEALPLRQLARAPICSARAPKARVSRSSTPQAEARRVTVPGSVPAKVPAKKRRDRQLAGLRPPRYLTGDQSCWRFQMRLSPQFFGNGILAGSRLEVLPLSFGPRWARAAAVRPNDWRCSLQASARPSAASRPTPGRGQLWTRCSSTINRLTWSGTASTPILRNWWNDCPDRASVKIVGDCFWRKAAAHSHTHVRGGLNVLTGLSARSFGRFATSVTRIATGASVRGLPHFMVVRYVDHQPQFGPRVVDPLLSAHYLPPSIQDAEAFRSRRRHCGTVWRVLPLLRGRGGPAFQQVSDRSSKGHWATSIRALI